MSNRIIVACNVTHIKTQSYVAVTAWGFHIVLCARDRVLFMRAWEKRQNEGGKQSDIEADRQKKAKQTSLIEYNCVYERGGNALCTAQRERKLLGSLMTHDDWWLDHHGNLVHSHSGMETGALEPGAMTSSFEMSQNSNSKTPFLKNYDTRMNCWRL